MHIPLPMNMLALFKIPQETNLYLNNNNETKRFLFFLQRNRQTERKKEERNRFKNPRVGGKSQTEDKEEKQNNPAVRDALIPNKSTQMKKTAEHTNLPEIFLLGTLKEMLSFLNKNGKKRSYIESYSPGKLSLKKKHNAEKTISCTVVTKQHVLHFSKVERKYKPQIKQIKHNKTPHNTHHTTTQHTHTRVLAIHSHLNRKLISKQQRTEKGEDRKRGWNKG